MHFLPPSAVLVGFLSLAFSRSAFYCVLCYCFLFVRCALCSPLSLRCAEQRCVRILRCDEEAVRRMIFRIDGEGPNLKQTNKKEGSKKVPDTAPVIFRPVISVSGAFFLFPFLFSAVSIVPFGSSRSLVTGCSFFEFVFVFCFRSFF